MTDWRAAGRLADAHRVAALLAGPYDSPAKRRIRAKAVRFLAKRNPERVLDAWGGGTSANLMVDAGLRVLSVDDGRSFASAGITRARGLRAMSICGAEREYETAPGSLRRHATDCDAAFLDFMGHWCKDHERTLNSCRAMKAVVVTLMPERADFGSLTPVMWQVAYSALIEAASGMRVRWVERYMRQSGLPALVFACDRNGLVGERVCACGCGKPLVGNSRKRYFNTVCAMRARAARDPEAKAKAARRARERYRANPELGRAMAKASHEKYYDRSRAIRQAKLAAETEEERDVRRARQRKWRAEREARRSPAEREARREELRIYHRTYYAQHRAKYKPVNDRWRKANPEKCREYTRRYRERKAAA